MAPGGGGGKWLGWDLRGWFRVVVGVLRHAAADEGVGREVDGRGLACLPGCEVGEGGGGDGGEGRGDEEEEGACEAGHC